MSKKSKTTPEKKAADHSTAGHVKATKKTFSSASSKMALLLEDPEAKIYKSICWTCPGIIRPDEWLTKEEMLLKNKNHRDKKGNEGHNTDYKIKHTQILPFE